MPDFKTRNEEADYFDTHFLEEWRRGQPVRIRRVYDHPIQVRLDEGLDRELQRFADERGLKKSTLARQWLQECIQRECERHKAS